MSGDPKTRNGVPFSDLLDAVYATALEPEGFDSCLRLLGDAIGAVGPGLSVYERVDRQEMLGLDVSAPRMEEWKQRFTGPLQVGFLRSGVRGTFLASEISAIPIWSEFLDDWIHPQGFTDLLEGASVADGVIYGFGVFRERSTRAFGADQIALVDHLMPHIVRATQLHGRLAQLASERDAAGAALERLGIGFLLLDRRGRVLEASAGAQDLFAACDGLDLRRGAIQVDDTRARRLLCRLLAEVAADPTHPGGSLAIPRPSGRRPYEVLAMRLPHARFRWGGALATAVAFVTDPEHAPRTSAEVLQQLYGLTPAEARLAAQLAAGRSLAEIAERQRVHVRTVRNQLGSIFAKTQTQRQGELVSLLLSGLGRLASG